MTRGQYTCFMHPMPEQVEHDISDLCPECSKPYDFPLKDAPIQIREYKIVEAISRGFYAATYLTTYGTLNAKAVLKVTPKDTYRVFSKDFSAESQLHLQVSQGTQHLAAINDAFDCMVKFGEIEIPCHVAHLDYVEGDTLATFLSDPNNRTARNLAQISVDLFSLMQELAAKQKYHNDLHDKNIIVQQLDRASYRSEENIQPAIRAVAIDLGSITEVSKSVPSGGRPGDLLQVVRHILTFRNYLLENPQSVNDMEYRLAMQLDQIGHMLAPDPLSQREPPYRDFIKQITDGYGRTSSPWRAPSDLTSFSESYNAQTLHPSFVRPLLVDPDNEWLTMVSGNGPQVITGIRGCGKTMLLKALQCHSQISHYINTSTTIEKAIDKIRKDGYIGLYVPTNRLLDNLGNAGGPVHEPYVRLFVAYAWEALKAARHLREYKPSLVTPGYWRHISRAVASYVKGGSQLQDLPTELALESELFSILVSLDKGEDLYTLVASPAVAFPALADSVRQTSDIWADATVLFLLDDVSTRNLGQSDIGKLLGTLLFAHPHCAFKMTTEIQTMELILKSPGLIETARVGRDYDTFDLATRVIERLTNGNGIDFVERILDSRSIFYPKHPQLSPRQLLGDATLEQIARDIASTSDNAPQKKAVYRGLRALTALCVGDIGDILKLYEAIITHYDGSGLPIPPDKQSGEFQEYCSKQLYHLNRRDGELKDFALSFAQAAHRLLLKSATPAEPTLRGQLRQYTQLYVRVTTGDMKWQFEKLRELVDAGVFVLRGGPDVPRTKTRDSNPTQHFILTFRKLYGLSSFIGLSNRDRFELSGQDLIDWLENPAAGAVILGRNLGLSQDNGLAKEKIVDERPSTSVPGQLSNRQLEMTMASTEDTRERKNQQHNEQDTDGRLEIMGRGSENRLPVIQEIHNIAYSAKSIATIVASLGFEERALVSSKRIFSKIRPIDAVLVSYPVRGYADEIRGVAKLGAGNLREWQSEEVNEDSFVLPKGEVMVDVTGLAKPAIFKVVSQALARDRTLIIAHTQANAYYPLDEDIEPILAPASEDMFAILENARGIWTGEKAPYEFVRLLRSDVDQTRRRLLCAAVSPQHERLLSLVEQRDYDGLCIIEPEDDTPRSRLARLAADVATQGRFGSRRAKIGSNDLVGIVASLGEQFDEFYGRDWFDIEFGLTGSKMHAVACAAVSVVLKIAQCWYVRPAEFDAKRFTKGAGETRFFRISLPGSHGEID